MESLVNISIPCFAVLDLLKHLELELSALDVFHVDIEGADMTLIIEGSKVNSKNNSKPDFTT